MLSLTARSATLDGYEWYYLRPIPVTDREKKVARNIGIIRYGFPRNSIRYNVSRIDLKYAALSTLAVRKSLLLIRYIPLPLLLDMRHSHVR